MEGFHGSPTDHLVDRQGMRIAIKYERGQEREIKCKCVDFLSYSTGYNGITQDEIG